MRTSMNSPAINHRVQTGRFMEVNNKEALKNKLALERAIISNTTNSSRSFAVTPHLNRSNFVTGLLATIAFSAVVLPCVGAPVQDRTTASPKYALDPLAPEAIKGGVPINDQSATSCLVKVVVSGAGSCTGTAVSPNVVLTAQHCVVSTNSEDTLTYVYGADSISVRKTNGDASRIESTHQVSTIFLADGYLNDDKYNFGSKEASTSSKNDLAVLRLKNSISCTPFYNLPSEEAFEESVKSCKQRFDLSTCTKLQSTQLTYTEKRQKCQGNKGDFYMRGYGQVNTGDSRNHARQAQVQCKSWDNSGKHNTVEDLGGVYKLTNAQQDMVGHGDSGGPLTWILPANHTEYQLGVANSKSEKSKESFYTSLAGRVDYIQQIISTGNTNSMKKVGCIQFSSHFAYLWDSMQKFTLTNTCQQTEHAIVAMGHGENGVMLEESEDVEHGVSQLILASGVSKVISVPKNMRPIFVLSRT